MIIVTIATAVVASMVASVTNALRKKPNLVQENGESTDPLAASLSPAIKMKDQPHES